MACAFAGRNQRWPAEPVEEGTHHSVLHVLDGFMLGASLCNRPLGVPLQDALSRRGAVADVRVNSRKACFRLRQCLFFFTQYQEMWQRGRQMREQVQIAGYCRQNIGE